MLVQFTHPAVEPAAPGRPLSRPYTPGRVYDLSEDLARLWMARGCAIAAPIGAKATPEDAEPSMRIRFTHPAAEPGDAKITYAAGQEIELPQHAALGWIGRGVAVDPAAAKAGPESEAEARPNGKARARGGRTLV